MYTVLPDTEIFARDVHPLNESADIVDFLISISFNAVHPLKALDPMVVEVVEVEEELKVTDDRAVHPLNESTPTEVMLLRFAFVKDLQFLNALAPMEVNPLPNVTDPIDRLANAEASIVTDPEMVSAMLPFVNI